MREKYDMGPHKYQDPFTCYLDALYCEGRHDEECGDVNDYGLHYARFGRHVMVTDEQGFVTREVGMGAWRIAQGYYEAWLAEVDA